MECPENVSIVNKTLQGVRKMLMEHEHCQRKECSVKKKVKARRLLALVLVAAVVLSVNTTVFAANESESEEPAVCTMDGSCK